LVMQSSNKVAAINSGMACCSFTSSQTTARGSLL
jgi:hypothetical protein